MVRTKADRVPTKAVGSKAPQKAAKNTPVKKSTSGGSKGKNYSGGNPYHPRDTPEWQKPITCFLNQTPDGESPGEQSETAQENQDKNANEEAGNESE